MRAKDLDPCFAGGEPDLRDYFPVGIEDFLAEGLGHGRGLVGNLYGVNIVRCAFFRAIRIFFQSNCLLDLVEQFEFGGHGKTLLKTRLRNRYKIFYTGLETLFCLLQEIYTEFCSVYTPIFILC